MQQDDEGKSPPKASVATEPDVAKESPLTETIPYTQLFRFASATDWVLIVFGTLSALAAGATQPMFAVLFGQLIDAFGGSEVG